MQHPPIIFLNARCFVDLLARHACAAAITGKILGFVMKRVTVLLVVKPTTYRPTDLGQLATAGTLRSEQNISFTPRTNLEKHPKWEKQYVESRFADLVAGRNGQFRSCRRTRSAQTGSSNADDRKGWAAHHQGPVPCQYR